MRNSTAEKFPHHGLGLCGCMNCLARNSSMWESS